MKHYPLEKYNFTYEDNKVIAATHDAGITIQATATCCPEDNFDTDIGKKLAAARCNFKVATRKLRRATHKIEEIEYDMAAVERSLYDAYEFRKDAEEQYDVAYTELAKIENLLK